MLSQTTHKRKMHGNTSHKNQIYTSYCWRLDEERTWFEGLMLVNYRLTENQVRAADTTLRNCFHLQCQAAGFVLLTWRVQFRIAMHVR